MLNIAGVIPSPHTFEIEIEMGNVQVRVVTRAQPREAGREAERRRESPRHSKDIMPDKSETKQRRKTPRSQKTNSKKFIGSTKPSVESIAEKLRPKIVGKHPPDKSDDISLFEVSKGGLMPSRQGEQAF